MLLISDADPLSPGLNSMKRWCSSTLALDAAQAQPCLDAMEPDQILLVEDQPSTTSTSDWITQLKLQAEARQVLCTSVRPRA